VCHFQFIRYQKLYKTLLEKSEELETKLNELKEDDKNTFVQAKKNFEDKGMEALHLLAHYDLVLEVLSIYCRYCVQVFTEQIRAYQQLVVTRDIKLNNLCLKNIFVMVYS